MTKTELQSALAEATQTDKRTAGAFLDTTWVLKRHLTEHADSDQIAAHFPSDVLAGDGSMVGYYEILPYVKSV